jgi:DNA-binding PadR family transcriptional regulator
VQRENNEKRRYYQLTASGETVARDELARLRTLVSRLSQFVPGMGGVGL